MKYRRASHYTFDCRYHIVWITRWRNDAIWWEMQESLDKRLREISKQMYVNVISIGMESDHVHIFVSIPPSKPIPYVVNRLKGVTSREIMEEYRSYLRRWYWWENATLRARGYFVCAVGEVTADIVKHYVESQWEKEVLWEKVEII